MVLQTYPIPFLTLLCNLIEVEKPRKNFKCKTNSCRMPKYKLYRLYFHFITFQITTNALVLAQPSNSDQTLRHFKVQIRFATKDPSRLSILEGRND